MRVPPRSRYAFRVGSNFGPLSTRAWTEFGGGGSGEVEGWDGVRVLPPARSTFKVVQCSGHG